MSPFDFDRLQMRLGGFGRLRSMGLNSTASEGYTPDYALWNMLDRGRLGGFRFERNARIGGEVSVSFYCEQAKLAVDLSHDDHEIRKREDNDLDVYCAARGVKVLRFSREEVLLGLDGARNTILQDLLERTALDD